MPYPHIEHHGGKDGVTGSCHQLRMNAGTSLLIDCGLFQGNDASIPAGAGADRLSIEFPLDTQKALVATHVHIYHVGRIPYLLAAGFDGPMLCSEPSAKLLPIVLEDAFKLGFSRDQAKIEQYIQLVEQRIIALPYEQWFTLTDTDELLARLRLQRAGHLLGYAYVEIDLAYPQTGESKRVVFSGDLGAPHVPFMMPPESPERADILVLEGTYGDRIHEDRSNRRKQLEAVIEQALEDHRTVLIPAISIGCTQELPYELEEIILTKLNTASAPDGASLRANNGAMAIPGETNWPKLPTIVDSPLASRFTEAYRSLKLFWNQEARDCIQTRRRPLAFEELITMDSHGDRQRMVNHLSQTGRSVIVVAGGGMCIGGSIVNYLKAMLHDPRHDVLFVDYQAQGTPGQAIQQYGPKGGCVDLDGERFDIRANVTSIGSYSAHADQKGLVEFVTGMQRWPTEIRVVHGEERAKQALTAELRNYLSFGGR